MGDFFEKKAHIFMVLKTAIRGIETMDLDQKHHYEQIEKCTEEFSDLCQNVWNNLMAGEGVTADQLEVCLCHSIDNIYDFPGILDLYYNFRKLMLYLREILTIWLQHLLKLLRPSSLNAGIYNKGLMSNFQKLGIVSSQI